MSVMIFKTSRTDSTATNIQKVVTQKAFFFPIIWLIDVYKKRLKLPKKNTIINGCAGSTKKNKYNSTKPEPIGINLLLTIVDNFLLR